MNYPDNNPKTLVGATKVPLHLVPPSATHYLALALEDGGKKYGPYNWRDIPISVSTYKAAAMRHLDAFWDGEELASDSKVHHLAHAMACMALMLDAMTVGTLVDDRPTKGAAAQLQAAYTTKEKPLAIPAIPERDLSPDRARPSPHHTTWQCVGAGPALTAEQCIASGSGLCP